MAGTYFSKKDREFIQKRAKYRCEYCLLLEKYMDCVNEHIIAKSCGGTDDLDNIANGCIRCNGFKYNKIEGFDEVSNKVARLYHPRTNVWDEHFKWDENYIQIIGITAIGRVTVNTLKMNHQKSKNLRKLMRISFEHPPVD